MNEIAFAILRPVASKGIGHLWENKKALLLYFKTTFGKYRKQKIRFSLSYLFRIRVPNTDLYLLVFNRRISNQLQPVGGVYKRYGDDKLFESWGYQLDNKKNGLGTDEKSEQDLRFKVDGKNVINVIKWFEEGKEREISAEREFIEELIEPGILDATIFNKLKYKHVKRVSKNLKWSEYHQCYEVLIYDIMELLPDNSQKEFLVELHKKNGNITSNYAFVECDDIEQLRFMDKGVQVAKIGEHTKLIINNDKC